MTEFLKRQKEREREKERERDEGEGEREMRERERESSKRQLCPKKGWTDKIHYRVVSLLKKLTL